LARPARKYRDEERSLDLYLKEIGTTPLINADKEVELAKQIRQGDHGALEQLTKANLRFVVSVAKQYQNQGLSLADLINEGNIGLIKAAKRFDETRGFKFISYAVWWIRRLVRFPVP
jgi:RNA polymerase primary sigma factor